MSRTYKARGAVAEVLTFPVDSRFYNWTAVVSYFSDAEHTLPVAPTAGTVAISGLVSGAVEPTEFSSSPISSTDLSGRATEAAPVLEITVTPTAISGNGVAYYSVTVTGSVSAGG